LAKWARGFRRPDACVTGPLPLPSTPTPNPLREKVKKGSIPFFSIILLKASQPFFGRKKIK
jgi:hypothetical protein